MLWRPLFQFQKKWIFLGGWKDFFCDPCFSNFRIVFFHNLYSKEKAEEILQHFWHLYRNIFKLHSVFLSQCVHKPMIKPNMSEKNFFTETEFSNSCWQQVNQFPWNCLEKSIFPENIKKYILKTGEMLLKVQNSNIASLRSRQACSSHCNSRIGRRQCCLCISVNSLRRRLLILIYV